MPPLGGVSASDMIDIGPGIDLVVRDLAYHVMGLDHTYSYPRSPYVRQTHSQTFGQTWNLYAHPTQNRKHRTVSLRRRGCDLIPNSVLRWGAWVQPGLQHNIHYENRFTNNVVILFEKRKEETRITCL